jgi:hypothetical protein
VGGAGLKKGTAAKKVVLLERLKISEVWSVAGLV